MRTVEISKRQHNCGTHAIGLFIYSKWDSLLPTTQDKMIDILNIYYNLQPNVLTQGNLKSSLSHFSSHDIQIIMSLALNEHIMNNEQEYHFYWTSNVKNAPNQPTNFPDFVKEFKKDDLGYWGAGCLSWLMTDLIINHQITSTTREVTQLSLDADGPVAVIQNPTEVHFELAVTEDDLDFSELTTNDDGFFEKNLDDEKVRCTFQAMVNMGMDNYQACCPELRPMLTQINQVIDLIESKAAQVFQSSREKFDKVGRLLDTIKGFRNKLYTSLAANNLGDASEDIKAFKQFISDNKEQIDDLDALPGMSRSSGPSHSRKSNQGFFFNERRNSTDPSFSDLFDRLFKILESFLTVVVNLISDGLKHVGHVFS
ncbi:MAG TPA: hypothetical protein QF353_00375 [Gammaproteobacteria bacterium]|nr:hypothetical protein [Gammaproteobacteria bacterium]